MALNGEQFCEMIQGLMPDMRNKVGMYVLEHKKVVSKLSDALKMSTAYKNVPYQLQELHIKFCYDLIALVDTHEKAIKETVALFPN
jgi:hypothetical protein